MDLDRLQDIVGRDAAIRRRQRLQPAGGPGSLIFPPTYPGKDKNDPPRHVFEKRRIDGRELVCALIDSVQSQANRMEEALLAAARAGHIDLPRVEVVFPSPDDDRLPPVGTISVLEAPHRIFDAILRDSRLGNQRFAQSDLGQRIVLASPGDASAILEAAPSTLLFGAWNSTGVKGGLGQKFTRVIASEIIGIDVPVEEVKDPRTGDLRTAARRTSSRIDPLGISKDAAKIYRHQDQDQMWTLDPEQAALKDGKPQEFSGKTDKKGPAAINHGNIKPSVAELGVTCDHALQIVVISLAGLRRLRFGSPERDEAARALIAALGLVAVLEADAAGHALRSRCDLVCDGRAPFELVAADGSVTEIALDVERARALYRAAFEVASQAGFRLDADPVILRPSDGLVNLVRKSQEKLLAGAAEDAED